MTDLHERAAELLAKCDGMTEGPWVAALERGCHGIIAQILPEGGANFVAMVGNDTATPEREPVRFANARAIASLPEALALIRALTAALREAQMQAIADDGQFCDAVDAAIQAAVEKEREACKAIAYEAGCGWQELRSLALSSSYPEDALKHLASEHAAFSIAQQISARGDKP